MQEKMRIVNLGFLLRSGRAGRIEFWQDNGNGTCTRVSDGLTLTRERYDDLPGRPYLALCRRWGRLQWNA